jgi:hypothetical protein
MKTVLITLLFFQYSLVVAKDITLKDGSTVVGDIVTVKEGIYTIKTKSLGTITLPDQMISSINATKPVSSKHSGTANMRSIQASLMNNKAVMKSINHLQNNPAMLSILQDKSIMEAIQSGNYSSLMNNKKFSN